MSVYSRYKGTARRAPRRVNAPARDQEEGTIHPHPDRSWSDAHVDRSRPDEQWRTVHGPKIDEADLRAPVRCQALRSPARTRERRRRPASRPSCTVHGDKLLGTPPECSSARLVKQAPKTIDDARPARSRHPTAKAQARIVTSNLEIEDRDLGTGLEVVQVGPSSSPEQILEARTAARSPTRARSSDASTSSRTPTRTSLQDAFWDLQLDLMSAPPTRSPPTRRMVSESYESRLREPDEVAGSPTGRYPTSAVITVAA